MVPPTLSVNTSRSRKPRWILMWLCVQPITKAAPKLWRRPDPERRLAWSLRLRWRGTGIRPGSAFMAAMSAADSRSPMKPPTRTHGRRMSPASSIHPDCRFGHTQAAVSVIHSNRGKGGRVDWDMLALWVCAVLSFAAFFFALYLIWAKCESPSRFQTKQAARQTAERATLRGLGIEAAEQFVENDSDLRQPDCRDDNRIPVTVCLLNKPACVLSLCQ